jgi:hypothetical protein
MKRVVLTAAIAAAGLTGWATVHFADAAGPVREAVVYKSESCGCCTGWIAYLEQNGYTITTHTTDDVDSIKDEWAVPQEVRSCHTAKIGGYVIEGHVPVEAIDKLLATKPKITGIAAPGMPSGSPGMSGPKEPNVIVSFGGGTPQVVGTY